MKKKHKTRMEIEGKPFPDTAGSELGSRDVTGRRFQATTCLDRHWTHIYSV